MTRRGKLLDTERRGKYIYTMTTRPIERSRFGIEDIAGEVVTWPCNGPQSGEVAEIFYQDGYRSGWFVRITDGRIVSSGAIRVVQHEPYDSHCACGSCSRRLSRRTGRKGKGSY